MIMKNAQSPSGCDYPIIRRTAWFIKTPSVMLYSYHQTFQVLKMEVLTYISCMEGLCKGKPTPRIAL